MESELLKVADVQTHIRAKFSRTCAKFCTFESKIGKTGFLKNKSAQFDKIVLKNRSFYDNLSQFLYAKCSVKNLPAQNNSLLEGLAGIYMDPVLSLESIANHSGSYLNDLEPYIAI